MSAKGGIVQREDWEERNNKVMFCHLYDTQKHTLKGMHF